MREHHPAIEHLLAEPVEKNRDCAKARKTTTSGLSSAASTVCDAAAIDDHVDEYRRTVKTLHKIQARRLRR